jgi:hypothetical protein
LANEDHAALEIDILDAQRERLVQPQTGAIHEAKTRP